MPTDDGSWLVRFFEWLLKLLGFKELPPGEPKVPDEGKVFPRDPPPPKRPEEGLETNGRGRVTVDPDADPIPNPEELAMTYDLKFNDYLIPHEPGHATCDWPEDMPVAVTWHWTAGWTNESCRDVIGGTNPTRKGKASAHVCIGRSFEEGIDRYVPLERASYHAGVNQTLRWDGQPKTKRAEQGALTAVGIETTNVGYERNGVPAKEDWVLSASENGKVEWKIQPWTEEQIEMMIAYGRYIVEKFPHIKPEDHHGHSDICPGYKYDVETFPWRRVLQGIYPGEKILDIWTPFLLVTQRQRALVDLGYDLGKYGPNKDGIDGDWGRTADGALRDFQVDHALVENGYWTVFVARVVFTELMKAGKPLP